MRVVPEHKELERWEADACCHPLRLAQSLSISKTDIPPVHLVQVSGFISY